MSTGSSRRAKTPEQRNEEVKTLVGQLHDAVVGLCQDDRWTSMLQVTASLPHYSFGNRLLLLSQAEQRGMALTAVMSYRAWQKAGRQVRKGERGLRILAPRRRRLSPLPRCLRSPRPPLPCARAGRWGWPGRT